MNVTTGQPGRRMRRLLRAMASLTVGYVVFVAAQPRLEHGWKPIGNIDSPRLSEASGLAQNSRDAELFWSHNDSGHPPEIYAIRTSGKTEAVFPVPGATCIDWEDIASDGKGTLYIGDFGDNMRRRTRSTIYVVEEPRSTTGKPAKLLRLIHYSLPAGPANTEALFYHAEHVYIITKEERPTRMFRIAVTKQPDADPVATARLVTPVPVSPVTAADYSSEQGKLAVLSYGVLAVFDVSDGFESVGKQKPAEARFPFGLQTEACCFDGEDIIVIAESGQVWHVTPGELERGMVDLGVRSGRGENPPQQ